MALFLLVGCASTQKSNIINQRLDSRQNKEVVLVKIINDSCCPEGLQCVWSGDITFEVAAYESKKMITKTQLTVANYTEKDVLDWFTQYLPEHSSPIKQVIINPYPKKGHTINSTDYFIQLIY